MSDGDVVVGGLAVVPGVEVPAEACDEVADGQRVGAEATVRGERLWIIGAAITPPKDAIDAALVYAGFIKNLERSEEGK